MRKVLAIFLAVVLILGMTGCFGEKTKTIYVQTQSLRTIGEQVIRTEYTYSAKGTPISVKTYFNDSLYQTASTRTVNGVSYQTIVDKDGNQNTQSTQVTKDANGNVTMVEISVGTNPVSRTTYTYDDQNRTIKASSLTTLGVTEISYTYDAAGNIAQQIVDDETDDTYTRTVYTYDDRNYVLEEKVYDKDDVLRGSIRYQYTENNQGRTAVYYDAEGKTTGQKVESQYDEHGNLTQEITYQDDVAVQTIVNTYEAMEIPVEE